MSRIGRNPVPVPSGVEVTLAERLVTVKGPRGTLSRQVAGRDQRAPRRETLLVERPRRASA